MARPFLALFRYRATDLGGGNIVILRDGTSQVWNKITFKPALVIDSYNLRNDRAIAAPDWDRIFKAFGGFALELADSSDYQSFAAFREHLAATTVKTSFENPGDAFASYKSGNDVLETKLSGVGNELILVDPKVNGRSALLPPGVLRDTTTSVQGTAARIEKLGAVLLGDDGRMKFLQVEPKSGTFVGWNPLPDVAKFSLSVPGGLKIQSDGRIGLARVQVNPLDNHVIVARAWREGQERDPGAATAFVLTGFRRAPTVEFNGAPQTDLATRMIHGGLAYLIPLQSIMKSQTDMENALSH